MNGDALSDDTPTWVSQTLPQIGHCVLYAPYDAHEKAYDLDLVWFRRNLRPKRRSHIREQHPGEFETWNFKMPIVPLLWVHVIELSAGFHLVYPLWRGHAGLNVNASTDNEVAAIVAEFFRRGGVDHEAISKWEAATREANMATPAVPTKKTWGRT
jgi:hypothetical protein